jgi:hexosaminidase
LALIPAPARQRPTGSGFALAAESTISAPPELTAVAELFATQLAADGGPRLHPSRRGAITVRLVDTLPGAEELPVAIGVSPAHRDPADERYALGIDGAGIVVRATAPEGVHRGLTSLRQIVAAARRGPHSARLLAGREIVDGPRVAWRGLSLDVVRCFFRPDEVRTIIDMLALYKYNVLHLHLSDNEGWRLEIPGYPELTDGSDPRAYYTRAEFGELVEYASARFITVVPELDLPGHAAAVLRVYPQLGVDDDAGHFRAAYLDPERSSARRFRNDVLSELIALTPGPYVHLGGDEAFGMPDELYAGFVSASLDLVRGRGKSAIGWQEVSRAGVRPGDLTQQWVDFVDALPSGPDGAGAILPSEVPSAVVEFFAKATGDLRRALDKGARVVLSPTRVAYFDAPHAGSPTEPAQEDLCQRLGLRHYPPTSLATSYDWEPTTVVRGITEADLAGVEAAIWCETVEDLADLQFLVTARLPGFAERGWSPRGTGTWEEYRKRLAAQAPLWRRHGWTYFTSPIVDWA